MTTRPTTTGLKSNYVLVPPPNFSYLEDTLCRCTVPISRNSISFLHSISVGCIINVSGKKIDSAIVSYCEEQGVLLNAFLLEGEDPLVGASVAKFEDWIAEKLEFLLFQSSNTNTLVIGSTENYLDCLLIACLRRFQQWSYISILSEFRQHTWPNKLYDFEQLIEHFDSNKISVPSTLPDYVITHITLQKEEAKMKERLMQATVDSAATSQSSSEGDDPAVKDTKQEQERVDRILHGLFFSSPNKLLSDGIEFDANLSLINDKDDED